MMTGPNTSTGYTLLEILVVLVIISIATSMAIVMIGHNQNKQMESFAKELVQTITLAEEQAMLQPAILGLAFTANTFRFYEYKPLNNKPSWKVFSDHELGVHPIPSNIQVILKMDNKVIPFSQLEQNNTPMLLISNNGTITPFNILISKKNQTPRYEIRGEIDGTITTSPISHASF